jgi:putative endonuclease
LVRAQEEERKERVSREWDSFFLMTYYVYILYSESSDMYYVGSTDDWENRLTSHNESDRTTFTSKYRPWVLVAVFIAGNSRSEAMNLEKFIKKQKSRKLIEKLIDPTYLPESKLAQLVRVPHLRN